MSIIAGVGDLTFGDVYAAVLLRAPGIDPMLSREWVQDAYREACDHKNWSHQRAETSILCEDQKSGTVMVTRGSRAITASSMTLAATDVGRQIRVDGQQVYTVTTVADDLTTGTIDRAYAGVSGTVTMIILDAYWTAPVGFWRFLVVADHTNRWRLKWWITEDEISRLDPNRSSTGNSWALASQTYSPVDGSRGRARFELYPFVTAQRSYAVMYYTKPTVFAETSPLLGPFAHSKDLLIEGALARCALWPGTASVRNPYFNLQLADILEKRFKDKLQQLEVKDEDMYPTWSPYASYGWAPGPISASYLQSHVFDTIESSL